MSAIDKLVNLANAIREKSFTSDKMSLDDMVSRISESLEPSINETHNLLYSPNDFTDPHWSNDLKKQVGQDAALGPHYFWRAPDQPLLLQAVEGSKLGDVYIWKFYAKADQAGDKAHTELFGRVGAGNYTLSTDWEPCYSYATVSSIPPAIGKEVVYFGGVAQNRGKVYIASPVLVKIK